MDTREIRYDGLTFDPDVMFDNVEHVILARAPVWKHSPLAVAIKFKYTTRELHQDILKTPLVFHVKPSSSTNSEVYYSLSPDGRCYIFGFSPLGAGTSSRKPFKAKVATLIPGVLETHHLQRHCMRWSDATYAFEAGFPGYVDIYELPEDPSLPYNTHERVTPYNIHELMTSFDMRALRVLLDGKGLGHHCHMYCDTTTPDPNTAVHIRSSSERRIDFPDLVQVIQSSW